VEDIRDTRPWFWALIALLLAVAVVGLVLAISAKNSSVDEKKVVQDATAQVKEELSGLNGALKAANEFQTEENRAAARDRARIKRAVAAAVAGAKGKLHKLNARVASLESQASEGQAETAKLRKRVATLAEAQEAQAEEIVTIRRRLSKLLGNGGT
jgi:chromosome segregation ATPase